VISGSPSGQSEGQLTLTHEGGGATAGNLAAKLLCLHTVERFEVGGLRDAVAGVIGRYREDFRSIEIRLARPKQGVVDLPCTCPLCGAGIRLQVKSWLRTNLLALIALVALGLIITVIGALNIRSLGAIATGVTVFGAVMLCLPVLLALVLPRLMDTLSQALQIVHDVPRAEPFWIIGGAAPDKITARELRDRGMHQHKLDAIRRVN
jgi:hypothetical protein